MFLPKLNETSQSRLFTDRFYGINEGAVIGEGEFSSMKNLTSEFYPAMGTRQKRKLYAVRERELKEGYYQAPEYFQAAGEGQKQDLCTEEFKWFGTPGVLGQETYEMEDILGVLAKEKLFVVLGYKEKTGVGKKKSLVRLYYEGRELTQMEDTWLTYSKKKLVSMGAYICIFPDKKYLNIVTGEYGSMEAYFDVNTARLESSEQEGMSAMVIVRSCDIQGGIISSADVSETEPSSPLDGDKWLDISGEEYKLKKFDKASGMWFAVKMYIRLEWTGIDKYFSTGEVVEIKGFHLRSSFAWMKEEAVNGFHRVAGTGNHYLVLEADEMFYGLLWADENESGVADLSISRAVPDMDFVFECNNRIWGCKYGMVAGELLNEIYACKQGDMKSWYAYEGISTDSYALSVGSDGPFTGAVNYLGYPTFFKENQILRIYGNMPREYQLSATECRGVEKGSEKSLCVVNGILYYKSSQDVCMYDGSMPAGISKKLKYGYKNGIAGSIGQKYYISMERDGERHMLVYDIEKGMWHEEDMLQVVEMIPFEGDLLFVTKREIWGMRGEGVLKEKSFEWEAVSGVIGYAYPDKKYLSRFVIRAQMEPGAVFRVYLEYDSSGRFEYAGEVKIVRKGTVTIPVRPRRCDHMRMKFSGKGDCRIFSVSKMLEIGSDV